MPSIRPDLVNLLEHRRIFRSLLQASGTAGNLTTDAYLAALAIGHGAVIVSCDRDFARFPGLRWEHPLGIA
ncbi:MAG: type II toxin-antitoxin system VapC family toxin [Planctomycetes bacterium]|nr:type II toxin-antitoxin system VapC family toxin [Planctomycetota bacterium]